MPSLSADLSPAIAAAAGAARGPAGGPGSRVPAWVAILVLVACLAGLGVGLWLLFRDKSHEAVSLPAGVDVAPDTVPRFAWGGGRPAGRRGNGPANAAANRAGGGGGAAAPANIPPSRLPDGVNPWGSGFIVRAGALYLHVSRAISGPRDVRVNVFIDDLLTRPQQQWKEAARAVASDPALAAAVGASAEQVRQLKALDVPALKANPDDRQRLAEGWKAYAAAAEGQKEAAGRAVTAELTALAGRAVPALKAEYEAYLQGVRAALKPEQVEQYVRRQQSPPALGGAKAVVSPRP